VRLNRGLRASLAARTVLPRVAHATAFALVRSPYGPTSTRPVPVHAADRGVWRYYRRHERAWRHGCGWGCPAHRRRRCRPSRTLPSRSGGGNRIAVHSRRDDVRGTVHGSVLVLQPGGVPGGAMGRRRVISGALCGCGNDERAVADDVAGPRGGGNGQASSHFRSPVRMRER
jgi:hypothetical protein